MKRPSCSLPSSSQLPKKPRHPLNEKILLDVFKLLPRNSTTDRFKYNKYWTITTLHVLQLVSHQWNNLITIHKKDLPRQLINNLHLSIVIVIVIPPLIVF